MDYRDNELIQLAENLWTAVHSETNKDGYLSLDSVGEEMQEIHDYLKERNKL